MSSAETVVDQKQQPLPPQQIQSELVLSPLTGGYLLIVIGEPHSYDHKEIILQKISKGLLSWNENECLIDLLDELDHCSDLKITGESTKSGERIIQHATKQVIIEILIHPTLSTLQQCLRNMLSSFTRHRHLIHAGYTFASNGSWILQDGTFSCIDFLEAFQENEVQRVLKAYVNVITIDLHCSSDYGTWKILPENDRIRKLCKSFDLNGGDRLNSNDPRLLKFMMYVSEFLKPFRLEAMLEMSDIVGNIRFTFPTLYVFPAGQGDAALFGISGFNMLIDGGFPRKSCFWDFTRHLDRLDAVLMTRINNNNIAGIGAFLKRKTAEHVYPQIGHFFCNLQKNKKLAESPDGDKDKDPLVVNLFNEGAELVSNIKKLDLEPEPCYSNIEPINLYHKVGHGTLNMYVLNPQKDSKEVREFVQKWLTNDSSLFCSSIRKNLNGTVEYPIQNQVSMSVLLIWLPASSEQKITRLLFPGSTPQAKIFEGIEKLKNLEFLKRQVCRLKDLNSATNAITNANNRLESSTAKKTKVTRKEVHVLKSSPAKNGISTTSVVAKTAGSLEDQLDQVTVDNNGVGGMSYEKKVIAKSSRTVTRQNPEQTEKKTKVSAIVPEGLASTVKHSSPKKVSSSFASAVPSASSTAKSVTNSGSTFNSSKTLSNTRRSIVHSPTPPLVTGTSATSKAAATGTSSLKSTKDATNRKVVESKYLSRRETATTMKNDAVTVSSRKTLVKKPTGLSKSKRDSSISKTAKSVNKQTDDGSGIDMKKNLVSAAETIDLTALGTANVSNIPLTFDGESEEYLICSLDHKQQKLNIEVLEMKTNIDCGREPQDFHQNVGLTKETIKTPDEVADLPIDEEVMDSDSLSYANDEPKLKSDHLQTEKLQEKKVDTEKIKNIPTTIKIVDVKENLNIIEERDDDGDDNGDNDANDDKNNENGLHCVIRETHIGTVESLINEADECCLDESKAAKLKTENVIEIGAKEAESVTLKGSDDGKPVQPKLISDCEKDGEEIEENSKRQFSNDRKCQESNDDHQEQQDNKTSDRKKSILELSIKDQLEKALADGKFSLVSNAFKQSSDEQQSASKVIEKHEMDNTPEFENKDENEEIKDVDMEKHSSLEEKSSAELRDLMLSSFCEQQQLCKSEDNRNQQEELDNTGAFSTNLNQDLQKIVSVDDNSNVSNKDTQFYSLQVEASHPEVIDVKQAENKKDISCENDAKELSEFDCEDLSEKFKARKTTDPESESILEKQEANNHQTRNTENISPNLILKKIDIADDERHPNLSDQQQTDFKEKRGDKNTEKCFGQDQIESLSKRGSDTFVSGFQTQSSNEEHSESNSYQITDDEKTESLKKRTSILDEPSIQTQESVDNLEESSSEQPEENKADIQESSRRNSVITNLEERIEQSSENSMMKSFIWSSQNVESLDEHLQETQENLIKETIQKKYGDQSKDIEEKTDLIIKEESLNEEEKLLTKDNENSVLCPANRSEKENEPNCLQVTEENLENKILDKSENTVPEKNAVFSSDQKSEPKFDENVVQCKEDSFESENLHDMSKSLILSTASLENQERCTQAKNTCSSPERNFEQQTAVNKTNILVQSSSKNMEKQEISTEAKNFDSSLSECFVDNTKGTASLSPSNDFKVQKNVAEANNLTSGSDKVLLDEEKSNVLTSFSEDLDKKSDFTDEKSLNLSPNKCSIDNEKTLFLTSPSKDMKEKDFSAEAGSQITSSDKHLLDEQRDSTDKKNLNSSAKKSSLDIEKADISTSSSQEIGEQGSCEVQSQISSPDKCLPDDKKNSSVISPSKDTNEKECLDETESKTLNLDKELPDNAKNATSTSPIKDADKQTDPADKKSLSLSPNKCSINDETKDALTSPLKEISEQKNDTKTIERISSSNKLFLDNEQDTVLTIRSKGTEKQESSGEAENRISSPDKGLLDDEKGTALTSDFKDMNKEVNPTDEQVSNFSPKKCSLDVEQAALKETDVQGDSDETKKPISNSNELSPDNEKDFYIESTAKEILKREVTSILTADECSISSSKDTGKKEIFAEAQNPTLSPNKSFSNDEIFATFTCPSKDIDNQADSTERNSLNLSPKKCSLGVEKAADLTIPPKEMGEQQGSFQSEIQISSSDESPLNVKKDFYTSPSKDTEKKACQAVTESKILSPDKCLLDDEKTADETNILQSSSNQTKISETIDQSLNNLSEKSLIKTCSKMAEYQSSPIEILDKISENDLKFIQKSNSNIQETKLESLAISPDYLKSQTDLCSSKLYCSPAKSSCESLNENLEKSVQMESESSLEDSLEKSPTTCKVFQSSATSLVIENQNITSEIEFSGKSSSNIYTCAISSKISCDSLNDTQNKNECELSSKLSSDSLSGLTEVENTIRQSSIRVCDSEKTSNISSDSLSDRVDVLVEKETGFELSSSEDSKPSTVLENLSESETKKSLSNIEIQDKSHTSFSKCDLKSSVIETDNTVCELNLKQNCNKTSNVGSNDALKPKPNFDEVKSEYSTSSTDIISSEDKKDLTDIEKVESSDDLKRDNLSECCEILSFETEKKEIFSLETSEKLLEKCIEIKDSSEVSKLEIDSFDKDADLKSTILIKQEKCSEADDAICDLNFQVTPIAEEKNSNKLKSELKAQSSEEKKFCSDIKENVESSITPDRKSEETSSVDVLESGRAELSNEIITKIESYRVDERIENGQKTKMAIEIEKFVGDGESQMKINREDQSETKIEHRLDSNRFVQESVDESRTKQSILSFNENVVNFDQTISSEHDIKTIQLTGEKEAISSDHEEIRCTNRTIDNMTDGSQAIESSLESYVVRSCDISVVEPNSNRIQKQIIQSDKRQQIHEEVSRSDSNKYQSSTTIQRSSSTHSSTTSSPIHSQDSRRMASETADKLVGDTVTSSEYLIEQSGGEYETVQIVADEHNERLSTTIVKESFDIMKMRNDFDSGFDKQYDLQKKGSMSSEQFENENKTIESKSNADGSQNDYNIDVEESDVDDNFKRWRDFQFQFGDNTYAESYSYQYEITAAKFTTELGLLNFCASKAGSDSCELQQKKHDDDDNDEEEEQPKSTSSVEVIYSKTDSSELYDEKKVMNLETYWDSKPLGLPISTPTKSPRKTATLASATTNATSSSKHSKISKEGMSSAHEPIYVDLTYVPHHGNHDYAYVDFFKRIRARYYVFSGLEPTYEVFNALLEAKISWGMDDFEVTIIPTYDTDTLASWVADNEENLIKYKIDLSPSASRCTINLQDHDTSCSAYRLEF